MEVRCQVCGSVKPINESHRDFKAIAHNPLYPFICENCATKIQLEMQDQTGLRKFPPNPLAEPGSTVKKRPSDK